MDLMDTRGPPAFGTGCRLPQPYAVHGCPKVLVFTGSLMDIEICCHRLCDMLHHRWTLRWRLHGAFHSRLPGGRQPAWGQSRWL